jgi:hypothetical protein
MSFLERIFGLRKREETHLDRDTLSTMADFENSLNAARHRLGHTASGFEGQIFVQGPNAPDILKIIQELHRRSVSFRVPLDECLRNGKSFVIRSAHGGKRPSWSTMGQIEERVYINLDQIKDTRYGLMALIGHEFGHAAAGLRDGEAGRAGPNQIWLSGVLAEMGLPDIRIPGYGRDLG